MAGTHPEADVTMFRVAGGPGTGYSQTAPAARRLNQYFLGVAGARAWCLVVLVLVPGVWSLPICASSSSGLSLYIVLLATYYICPLSRSSKR